MKPIKQIICALISAAMCFCLFGCGSEEKESSKEETVVETTEQETTETKLDDTFTIDDITIPISSNWEMSDESDSVTESEKMYAFICKDDTGFLMINPSYHSTTQVAESIMQYRCVDYAGALNNIKEIDVSGIKITVCERTLNESVWTNYLFIIGTTLYDIGFSINQDYSESCYMYTNRDEIIKSIQFADIETTKNTDESSETEPPAENQTETDEPDAEIIAEDVESFEESEYEYFAEEQDEIEEDVEENVEENVEEENPDDSVTVYYTRTGKCYHYENPCGRGTYYECSLSEAKSWGLSPCEKCVLH
ncbi:MAG: hypothetical protein ACI4I9_04200 [Porcipelethomonas sp.]